MANSTANTLITYGLQLAKTGNATNIPGLDPAGALVRIVDRENRNFINAPYDNHQLGWDFMLQEAGWTLQTAAATTGALTSASVTIPVDDTSIFQLNASNGGAFVIYTSNLTDAAIFGARSASTGAGNLTTVSGLSFAHLSGDAIYTLYPLPTNFGRPRAEMRRPPLLVDTVPYSYGGTGEPMGQEFSIFKDTTNDIDYLWVPRDITGTAVLRYDKAPTSISSGGTVVDVPVDHEEYIIQKVAAHVMRVLSKEDSKIADCEAQAAAVLESAFAQRAINKRVSLARGPIRSPSSFNDGHFMTADGSVY